MSFNILTEDEIGVERAFEVRVIDLKTGKQRSFSLFTRIDAKQKGIQLDVLRDLILDAIKSVKR